MKPLFDWSVELRRMLDRRDPENLHLDYKQKDALLPLSKKDRASEISKDVSAFLNSDGGTIIYGIRETAIGKQNLPQPFDPQKDGFDPSEISKEDIENLITSNIQYRPGPDLFCISTVPMQNRYIFVVDIARSNHGVFQAKGKRYYKRFNFKSEPMEHYEVEDVRKRAISPDLRLILGLTDTWEFDISRTLNYQSQQDVYLGLINRGQTVVETALIEFGLSSRNLPSSITKESKYGFFVYANERKVQIDGGQPTRVRWYCCRWTPQNLQRHYRPLFPTTDPEYLMSIWFQIPQGNDVGNPLKGIELGDIYWRVQAPNMMPKTGMHSLKYALDKLSIELDPRIVQVSPITE
ncbi:MAG: ATP-binding protein [Dehalococcoidia bacterium]|nr:ATP-binding protein [Dehalococcoidia bacterium]